MWTLAREIGSKDSNNSVKTSVRHWYLHTPLEWRILRNIYTECLFVPERRVQTNMAPLPFPHQSSCLSVMDLTPLSFQTHSAGSVRPFQCWVLIRFCSCTSVYSRVNGSMSCLNLHDHRILESNWLLWVIGTFSQNYSRTFWVSVSKSELCGYR